MLPYSSLYDILNVGNNASIDEIKSTFRKLALIHHPDKNNNSPESETNFKIISNAYGILTDPAKRGEYDNYLRTSSVIKNQGKTAPDRKAALPGKTDGLNTLLNTLFAQINFSFWDIEDFLNNTNEIVLDHKYNGLTLLQYVLKILTFTDKWVLEPSGYQDYFMEARKMNKANIANYIYTIGSKQTSTGHSPFVNIMDYFYDVRKRLNKFLNTATAGDLNKTLPDQKIRVLDCLFEAQNYAVHYLSYINLVIAGETDNIPLFRHSNACFSS